MIKGYCSKKMGRIALGTHLGDFSEEDSRKYQGAIEYAIKNRIYTIDGAINYRGMCSEKDEGAVIRKLIERGEIRREDIFVTSKAGLLYGDVKEGMNPKKYLDMVLSQSGITMEDFAEYEGLYQTLNSKFYEIALNKSLSNLGLESLDVHYIHIPEITRKSAKEKDFYEQMFKLFTWYEKQVENGKIKSYGLALEFMAEEPENEEWHMELERLKQLSDEAGRGEGHLRYVIYEYNPACSLANNAMTQTVNGVKMPLSEACHVLKLETVGSMPFAMGEAIGDYSVEDLLKYALAGMDHVIFGSRNIEHIKEIINITHNIK